jgi:hypothetical protein
MYSCINVNYGTEGELVMTIRKKKEEERREKKGVKQ